MTLGQLARAADWAEAFIAQMPTPRKGLAASDAHPAHLPVGAGTNQIGHVA